MSSTKKSPGTLILLLLIFLIAAGGSWFYFTGKNPSDVAQDIAEQVEYDDEDAAENADQDDHSHDAHGHSNASAQDSQSGTIHKLATPAILGTRGVGDPNAPVQIQEFFSLTCNHCADFHTGTYQELKSKYIDTGKVYFIYQEFPLNGPALYGSMIARCLPEDRYAGFIDLLLRTQDKWAFGGDFKASLRQNAALAGMSEEDFDACFANQELQKAIATNIKEASDVWEISSTPSFIVNDGLRVMRGSKGIADFDKVVQEITGSATEEVQNNEPVAAPSFDPSLVTTEEVEEISSEIQETAEDAAEAMSDTATEVQTEIEEGIDQLEEGVDQFNAEQEQ